ncbi:uncharacterized protein LOC132784946 [Drosophila nasuta]|uniref:uncharacterized protein LOC132784946 n=1 Tax=Drosophila nasuta TaxID=42062 RepID=UPI00295EAA1A|nr:uncharacterized protein LOC132784946 [Drosophila nasuta]
MTSRDIPQGDMLQVSKSAERYRKEIQKFVPQIGLTCINYRDLGEVDYFYQECQRLRDYNRDALNKLHRPALFQLYHGKCGLRTDYDLKALQEPGYWVRERQPIVYPPEYCQRMNLDGSIRIAAHFAQASSNNFKR